LCTASQPQPALKLKPPSHAPSPHCHQTHRGSYVSALGATQVFPPRWSKNAPVDTCGAGDNYAAGLLYGLLQGMDVSIVSAWVLACAGF